MGRYEEAVEEMLVKTSTPSLPGAWWKATTSIGRAPRFWLELVEVLSAELRYKPADPLRKTRRASKPGKRK